MLEIRTSIGDNNGNIFLKNNTLHNNMRQSLQYLVIIANIELNGNIIYQKITLKYLGVVFAEVRSS